MKNRKFTKVALIALAMVLVCIVSVAGTLAYLTSQTDEVVNTFTVGDVEITLDEAPVDQNGQATTGDRVKANTYKLLPGKEYDKDPTVHVAEGSEECWLFVKIDNGIAAIEAEDTVATQMVANWTLVDGETNIYAYNTKVSGGTDVVVFDGFAISGDVDNTTLATYDNATIKVQAYAVQAEGFNTAAEAFEATSWAN